MLFYKHLNILLLIIAVSFLSTSCSSKKSNKNGNLTNASAAASTTNTNPADANKELENKNDSSLADALEEFEKKSSSRTTSKTNTKSVTISTTVTKLTKQKESCTDNKKIIKVSNIRIAAEGKVLEVKIDNLEKAITKTNADGTTELQIIEKDADNDRIAVITDMDGNAESVLLNKKNNIKQSKKDKKIEREIYKQQNPKEDNLVENVKRWNQDRLDIWGERRENWATDRIQKYAEKELEMNDIEAEIFTTKFHDMTVNVEAKHKGKVFRRFKKIYKFARRSNKKILGIIRAGLELETEEAIDFANNMMTNETIHERSDLFETYKESFKLAVKRGNDIETAMDIAEALLKEQLIVKAEEPKEEAEETEEQPEPKPYE